MAGDLDLGSYVRDVQDWPQPGVVFKDVTPLLGDPAAFASAIDRLAAHFIGKGITKVVGIEARGFVVAAPVAYRLDTGFVPARKPGKLPWGIESQAYELEYGTDELEMHVDAVEPGEKVLIVDDVLATGGTARAAVQLVQAVGGEVAGVGVVLELGFLGGAAKLGGVELVSLLTYD